MCALYPQGLIWQNAAIFLYIRCFAMSNILALDSSSDACSVALIFDNQVFSLFELAAKSHTQRLLPMVDEILQQAGCDRGALDAIAFGRGPGSFTGLRICLGVVQGLAYGLGVPVIPVSTLSAIASGYYSSSSAVQSATTLIALDARMEEIYWGLFKHEPGSVVPVTMTEEFVMSPALVHQHEIIRQLEQPVVGIGSGWHYPDLQLLPSSSIQMDVYPHAQDIARIAQVMMARGETQSAFDAQPVYLRDEVSWKKRQRIRTL